MGGRKALPPWMALLDGADVNGAVDVLLALRGSNDPVGAAIGTATDTGATTGCVVDGWLTGVLLLLMIRYDGNMWTLNCCQNICGVQLL